MSPAVYFGATSLAIIDAGRVDGVAGGAVTGCRYLVPTRTGAGVYRLTAAAGTVSLTAADTIVTIQQTFDPAIGGGSNKTYVWEFISATAIEVRFFAAVGGAAVDATFDFLIFYLGPPGVGVS